MINERKNYRFRNFIIVALSAIICFGVVFVKPVSRMVSAEEKRFNVTETNIYLANNGQTDYVIAIPNEPTENEIFAADDLRTFLNKSTGAEFKIVSEKDVSADKRYISVGKTNLFVAEGIVLNAEFLKASGYIVRTVNGNVYIVGNRDYGTVFGVYGFLSYQINYAYYTYDCIEYDTTKTVKLKNFDIVDVPDFEGRVFGDRTVRDYPERMMRYRQFSTMLDIGDLYHTGQYYISVDEYYEEHPEWFAGSKQQHCYSQDGLVDELCRVFQAKLLALPDNGKTIFMFGQSDTMGSCSCSKCTETVNQYGTITATFILFFNKLAEKMQVWIDENQPGREVYYGFIGYKWSQTPPVQYDEKTGTYSYATEMKMNEHVGVVICPIWMNYYVPITDPVNAEEQHTVFEAWAQLTDNLWYYGYYLSHNCTMYYPYIWNSQQANYKYLKDLGVSFIFELADYWVASWQTFKGFMGYISASLMWDVNVDQSALTEKYFNAYYKEGGRYMLQLFNEYREYFEILFVENNFDGFAFKLNKPEYWPMKLLERWIGLTDKAIEQIDRYRYTDIEVYNTLLDHITQEKTCLEYQMIELHGAEYYNTTELIAAKMRVINNMYRFSMDTQEVTNSETNINALRKLWGV